ncbi:MAG: PrsW family intramembrane metalloprotease [Lachnospiraceae bacterium]|nr:PrsW family intramembrane metalloprotease [Lachnospiraceae bacterium]
MELVYFIVALVVLGVLYSRMIRREEPSAIGKAQAVVPVVFGVLSMLPSVALAILGSFVLKKAGYEGERLPLLIRSFNSAFIAAGLPEETVKLLMMLLALRVFRSKVRNVYEYILIGAAVGFGFTLLEEFFYGSGSVLTGIIRFLLIGMHMVFGIIMAKHLGLARYVRITGRGSAAKEYFLAFVIPLLLHTAHDTFTVSNRFLDAGDDTTQMIGLVLSFATLIVMFAVQLKVLLRLRRDTAHYCEMVF